MPGEVPLEVGLAVEVKHVHDILAAVQLDPHGDLSRPAGRVDADVPGDDGLLEDVSGLVEAVIVSIKQLWCSVHLLVVGKVPAIGAVLDLKLLTRVNHIVV